MELLLNLVWLILVVPAIWLWRREPVSRKSPRLYYVLSLGCVLMLLFPVISATDDLYSICQETEESNSSPSKRTVTQAAGDKVPCWLGSLGTAPSQLISPSSFPPNNEVCGQVLTQQSLLRVQARLGTRAGRAPPLSLLS